jgi:hypothetical protein
MIGRQLHLVGLDATSENCILGNVIFAQWDTAIAECDAAIADLNTDIEEWEAAIDDCDTAQAKSDRLEMDSQRHLHAISKL